MAKISVERTLLSKLILRALNCNQIMVLLGIYEYEYSSISSILRALEIEKGIPLSTLKLNARILKELELVDFSDSGGLRGARLTEAGNAILDIVSEGV